MVSKQRKKEHVQNQIIEQELLKAHQTLAKTVRILLLGSHGSGKTTVAKQMKIIYLEGFTKEEHLKYKLEIPNSILSSFQTLIQQASIFQYALLAENENQVQTIMAVPSSKGPITITKDICQAITNVWKDPAIRQTLARSAEFQLATPISYYVENIERIAAPDYSPYDQDILRCGSLNPHDLLEVAFEDNNINIHFVDVGTSGSKRKWIHQFADVAVVMYCVDISEYDLQDPEDETTTKLQTSLQIFKDLCNSVIFSEGSTAFVLLLNKFDVFQEKIQRVPFTNSFPDYNGPQTYQDSAEYIKQLFLNANNSKRTVFPHFTCAVDTANISFVFKAIRETHTH